MASIAHMLVVRVGSYPRALICLEEALASSFEAKNMAAICQNWSQLVPASQLLVVTTDPKCDPVHVTKSFAPLALALAIIYRIFWIYFKLSIIMDVQTH